MSFLSTYTINLYFDQLLDLLSKMYVVIHLHGLWNDTIPLHPYEALFAKYVRLASPSGNYMCYFKSLHWVSVVSDTLHRVLIIG